MRVAPDLVEPGGAGTDERSMPRASTSPATRLARSMRRVAATSTTSQFNFTETGIAFLQSRREPERYLRAQRGLHRPGVLWTVGSGFVPASRTSSGARRSSSAPPISSIHRIWRWPSLPALEESRIALLSWRAVYSLYDVGPLEDVRVELAMNFDRVKPADLGACGEPYTPDIVCGLDPRQRHPQPHRRRRRRLRSPAEWVGRRRRSPSSAVASSSAGIASASRSSISTATTIFPTPSPSSSTSATSIRTRAWHARRTRPGSAATEAPSPPNDVFGTGVAGTTVIHGGDPAAEALLREARLSDGISGFEGGDPRSTAERQVGAVGLEDNFTAAGANDDWVAPQGSPTPCSASGRTPDCLKPGGAPDQAGREPLRFATRRRSGRFRSLQQHRRQRRSRHLRRLHDRRRRCAGPPPARRSSGRARASLRTTRWWTHPANQQLFNFICSGTGVHRRSAVAPEACAWNLWGSDTLLRQRRQRPAVIGRCLAALRR